MASKTQNKTITIPGSSESSDSGAWSRELATEISSGRDAIPTIELGQNQFRLKQMLGRGGMAEVYLASRVGPGEFSRKVVVKRILPEHSGEDTYVKRFLREASLAAQLHHPNIVEVLELGEAHGSYYIVMEYVDGKNLHQILKRLKARQEKIPPLIAARICADVASALNYAHSFVDDEGVRRRILHRDVSTTNVMLTFSGQVKLVDFGVAKDLDAASLTMGEQVVGKPLYLPPEAFRGTRPTLLWDVYALGLVLYLMLTGKSPFLTGKGPSGMARLLADISNKIPDHVRDLDPEIPLELDELVATTLAKDPLERPQSAAELASTLEGHLASQQPVTTNSLAWFVGTAFERTTDDQSQRSVRLPPASAFPNSQPTDSGPERAADAALASSPSKDLFASPPAPRGSIREYAIDRPQQTFLLWLVGSVLLATIVVLTAILFGPEIRDRARSVLLGNPEGEAAEQLRQRVGDRHQDSESPAAAVQEIGSIEVRCSQWGTVKIDGRVIGMCPNPPVVAAKKGRHLVSLEAAGRSDTRPVVVKGTETRIVDFDYVPSRRKAPRIINPGQQ